ncbi:hypothetical protein LSCM1_02424 [Leishmania martiniquensis]|uniref:Uncharacterized protein n=1 Tax=Leishmania martiniquensis TaxID=1580590 RepID=A0A836GAC7_9TRYP|nr:hypothetical protein LSCM1_02424 [Leishmania martiniquensis]
MSSALPQRSGGSCTAPCPEAARDLPPLRSSSRDAVTDNTGNTKQSQDEVQPHLDAIRRELEELRRRREQLEAQRKELLEGIHEPAVGQKAECSSSSISTHARLNRAHSTPGLTSAQPRSEMESLTAHSGLHTNRKHRCKRIYPDTFALAYLNPIPSEEERRRALKVTPQLTVKNALRSAAQQDSTLLMGDFLLEDNPHTCTFGRERRFRPLLGQKGNYFLSADFAIDERIRRRQADSSMSLIRSGNTYQTPGPGAYTPRYKKLSRPPRAY